MPTAFFCGQKAHKQQTTMRPSFTLVSARAAAGCLRKESCLLGIDANAMCYRNRICLMV